ncbi:MAG: YicC/YloC family endoribonuclease [Acidobacteriota bacterium]
MQSMTGFGHAEGTVKGMDLAVEVKTVNGRYLDVITRTPREMAALENPLKKRVQSVLKRGRVEVYVNLTSQRSDQYELNGELVESYLEMARQAVSMGASGELGVSTILQLPGTLAPRGVDFGSEEVEEALLGILDQALQVVLQERRHEGAALKEDLEGRLRTVQSFLQEIESQSGNLTEHYREKLSQRLQRLRIEQPVEASRLAQEVLFYAEKADFSEEMTRLRRHLERFEEQIGQAAHESVGKGLDFLCQELNREANTILSKCQNVEISELALQAKTEVERIREQVQNVE